METILIHKPLYLTNITLDPQITAHILSFLPFDRDFDSLRLVSREWNKQVKQTPRRSLLNLFKSLRSYTDINSDALLCDRLTSIQVIVSWMEECSDQAQFILNNKKGFDEIRCYKFPPVIVFDCLMIYFSLIDGSAQFRNRTWQDLKIQVSKINKDPSFRAINYYKAVTAEKLRRVKEEIQRVRIDPRALMKASSVMVNLYLWIQAIIECAEVNLELDEQTKQVLDCITSNECNRKKYRKLLSEKSFLQELLQN